MYSHFKGKIDRINSETVIIDVNDIGYEIYMPESEIGELTEGAENIKIYTHLNVREDDMKLFGFLAYETLEFFRKLISVSGVGPKVALGIISNITASDMCIAIATENVAALKKVPGIGPKMAQKIIFELKDKVIKEELVNVSQKVKQKAIVNPNIEEATTALQVLGYSKEQIKNVLNNLEIENDSVEEIIKKVLKQMQNI